MKKMVLVLVSMAVLRWAPLAVAGQDVANEIPTNLPGVTTAIAPPEGFDPLSASDQELATYGFPPRPDPQAAPEAYASWARAMAASKKRLIPQLKVTNIFHGSNRRVPVQQLEDGSGNSSNWSGAVAYSGATSYNNTTSFYEVSTDYVVPVAEQAFGTCSLTSDYASAWVGIDGDGVSGGGSPKPDVLQAGVDFDASCSAGSTFPSYYAWYEWYPNASQKIQNLAVSPGDDVYVVVWDTSATSGHAYIVNINTNTATTLNFGPPAGTSLIGNCAEWIVERPSVNGGLATLTNYISDVFWASFAWTFNAGFFPNYYPGSPGATLYTMLDNNSKPISFPTLLGTSGIWFYDEGSAR